MHTTIAVLSLLTTVLAAPAALPNHKKEHVQIDITPLPSAFNAGIQVRQVETQCQPDLCVPLWQACVIDCSSLTGPEWYVDSNA